MKAKTIIFDSGKETEVKTLDFLYDCTAPIIAVESCTEPGNILITKYIVGNKSDFVTISGGIVRMIKVIQDGKPTKSDVFTNW